MKSKNNSSKLNSMFQSFKMIVWMSSLVCLIILQEFKPADAVFF